MHDCKCADDSIFFMPQANSITKYYSRFFSKDSTEERTKDRRKGRILYIFKF
jgi:hypothetical protein